MLWKRYVVPAPDQRAEDLELRSRPEHKPRSQTARRGERGPPHAHAEDGEGHDAEHELRARCSRCAAVDEQQDGRVHEQEHVHRGTDAARLRTAAIVSIDRRVIRPRRRIGSVLREPLRDARQLEIGPSRARSLQPNCRSLASAAVRATCAEEAALAVKPTVHGDEAYAETRVESLRGRTKGPAGCVRACQPPPARLSSTPVAAHGRGLPRVGEVDGAEVDVQPENRQIEQSALTLAQDRAVRGVRAVRRDGAEDGSANVDCESHEQNRR